MKQVVDRIALDKARARLSASIGRARGLDLGEEIRDLAATIIVLSADIGCVAQRVESLEARIEPLEKGRAP